MDDRIVSPQLMGEEEASEFSLRPKRLSEFIGQEKLKDNISISIKAALARAGRSDLIPVLTPGKHRKGRKG